MKRMIASLILIAGSTHAQTPAQLQAEVVTLEAQVVSLSKQLGALNIAIRQNQDQDVGSIATQNGRLAGDETTIASLQTQVQTLQSSERGLSVSVGSRNVDQSQTNVILTNQIAALQANPIFALAPFVKVDLQPENGVNGPHITFSGANIHINNGMGQTALVNGLGNLIIGYDESPNGVLASDRAGSHDLVIGRYQKWMTGFADLICGEYNVAENLNDAGYGQFVAGYNNKTYYQYSSILGGQANETFAETAVVVGGSGNGALAYCSVVLGGGSNLEYGTYAVTLGGVYNSDSANPVQYSVTQ